jgi:hypothetical protein
MARFLVQIFRRKKKSGNTFRIFSPRKKKWEKTFKGKSRNAG